MDCDKILWGEVLGDKRNKWLNFGGYRITHPELSGCITTLTAMDTLIDQDVDHHADCPIGNPPITQQIMSY